MCLNWQRKHMSARLAKPDPVTLVGAGELRADQLDAARTIAPDVFALDGGADRAIALGVTPAAVLGDFDSISPEALATIPAIETPDQDYPDFDKALGLIDAPLILALGVTGSRFDHAMASISALLRHPHRKVIAWAGDDLVCLAPPRLHLTLEPGTRLSLYPMRAMRCGSRGLLWPTDGLVLDPFARIGTSNAVADGGRIEIAPDMAAMLLILPEAALGSLVTGLRAAPPWPTPARAR